MTTTEEPSAHVGSIIGYLHGFQIPVDGKGGAGAAV